MYIFNKVLYRLKNVEIWIELIFIAFIFKINAIKFILHNLYLSVLHRNI